MFCGHQRFLNLTDVGIIKWKEKLAMEVKYFIIALQLNKYV